MFKKLKNWWYSPITWGGWIKTYVIATVVSLFYVIWFYVKIGLISMDWLSEVIGKLTRKENEDED